MSFWGYDDICHNSCVWRDSHERIYDRSVSCFLLDDQFAYIPRKFADHYFGVLDKSAPLRHAPIILIGAPEDVITKRVVDSGAKLNVTEFVFRVMHYLTWAPPFSAPLLEGGACDSTL
eukprot:c7122_g1_i1.p1 GENE.c7122_g1_i1~~c7122_g1_i1.p1  ORF type:complete len:118 (+),score=22.92 c7122_g1_i1:601-954(+)